MSKGTRRARSATTIEIGRDLRLPIDAVTQTMGLIARKGGGKTYAGQKLARAARIWPRWPISRPRGDLLDLPRQTPYTRAYRGQ